MATRQQQAAATQAKASRAAALEVLKGQPLPLPCEPRATPALPDEQTAAEIILLGAEGLADAQIAHHLAIPLDVMQGWENTHSAIKDALSRARTAAQAWWEESARRALITENNRYPAGVFAQVMKARFKGYEDKPAMVVNINDLVVVSRRAPPEPLQERMAGQDKPLIEGRSVRLAHSPTASDEGEGSAEPSPCDPSAG